MTTDQAKAILAIYREDLPVDEIEGGREALALLERDPELQQWFAQEQQFDHDFGAALQEIPIPENLHDTILQSALSAEATASEDNVVAFPRRRFYWAAAAAVVLAAAGLVKYFLFPPPVVFPGSEFASVTKFCDDMAYYANSRFALGKFTSDFTKARDWLTQRQSPVFKETPGAIVEYKGMGCQSFLWGSNRVSLVCFKNSSDDIVHLFVINKAAFEEMVPVDQLQSMQVRHQLETGGWLGNDENLYLLVGSDPEVKIDDILTNATQV